jgi:hypothetical protein
VLARFHIIMLLASLRPIKQKTRRMRQEVSAWLHDLPERTIANRHSAASHLPLAGSRKPIADAPMLPLPLSLDGKSAINLRLLEGI